jgi:hypothetical protein
MISFFDLSSPIGARALAVAGSLIITVVLLSTAIVPASPAAMLTIGALA